jgi:hypothetical protein
MWWLVLVGCESVQPPVLADVQTEVFDRSCASSSCHGHGAAEGGLDLSKDAAYTSLVGVTATTGDTLVVPGDADASYLVWKLEDRPEITGDPMPQTGGLLPDDEVALVRAWIDGGALGGARSGN